jgi:hypothetical protein
MSQLQSSFRGSPPPEGIAPVDPDIRAAEVRVREQEALVQRLIVQGAPTQFAEDLLRRLTAAAEAIKAQRGHRRG